MRCEKKKKLHWRVLRCGACLYENKSGATMLKGSEIYNEQGFWVIVVFSEHNGKKRVYTFNSSNLRGLRVITVEISQKCRNNLTELAVSICCHTVCVTAKTLLYLSVPKCCFCDFHNTWCPQMTSDCCPVPLHPAQPIKSSFAGTLLSDQCDSRYFVSP